jgi:S-adenosylmethionine:tRNA ribosyltransferase-isomerase
MYKNFTGNGLATGADITAGIPADCLLGSYHYDLPEELVAQYPSPERGGSRLYVLNRLTEAAQDLRGSFSLLPELLPPGALLVANNSRVIPARLRGRREGGGKLEFLPLTPLPLLLENAETRPGGWSAAPSQALLRPSRKLKSGTPYALTPNLHFRILKKLEFGQCEALLEWRGNLLHEIGLAGSLPLPPYIHRPAEELDTERYQTSFSDPGKPGSVAAPTAGLHFTPELREELRKKGHDWAELTLFVGYGTFSPVRVQDIRRHRLHPEYVEISAACVEKVLRAKHEGRPVIAVGTTSTRALEGLSASLAGAGQTPLLAAYRGWLNCFIYPGRPEGPLRVIDGLITNFHLPESSLLMLVSSLCGRERLLAAYRQAVADRFRFFSYGDAMLVL